MPGVPRIRKEREVGELKRGNQTGFFIEIDSLPTLFQPGMQTSQTDKQQTACYKGEKQRRFPSKNPFHYFQSFLTILITQGLLTCRG